MIGPTGICGVGIMGAGMARLLIEAGRPVIAYDPLPSAMASAAAAGVTTGSVAEVVAAAPVIISSLPHHEALDETVAAIVQAPKRRILIETSTLAPRQKLEAAKRLAAAGHALLDAPISGSPAAGEMTIFVSGDKSVRDEVLPLLAALTPSHPYVGDVGAGTTMKLLANHLVLVHTVVAAEVVALIVKAGLDPELAVALLGSTPAASRVFQGRAPQMARALFEPFYTHMSIHFKDMREISDWHRDLDAFSPVFAAVSQIYRIAEVSDYGDREVGELVHLFEHWQNLESRSSTVTN
jgi:3-hydroxyisobutyrate dehydrogenase-like beta-hydroxyacid dehydrogenase